MLRMLVHLDLFLAMDASYVVTYIWLYVKFFLLKYVRATLSVSFQF